MAEPTDRLRTYEANIRALILDRQPRFLDDVDERRQRVYRRLARGGVSSAIRNACPIAASRETKRFATLVEIFLDEASTTTRFLRAVPVEFAAWVMATKDEARFADHPPPLAELIHWETAEVDVLCAPDAPAELGRTATPTSSPVVDPSTRLLAYRFAVHLLNASAAWPAEDQSVLLAWRSAERMRWWEPPRAAAMLVLAASEGGDVEQTFSRTDELAGRRIDRGYLRSWLVNLVDRGLIAGFVDEASTTTKGK